MTAPTTTIADLPEWMTTEEVARVLRVDEEYVRRQCKNGVITATNLRGKAGYRIHRDAILKFLGSDVPAARPRPPRERKRAR
jgi:excisionase family DNA binding protein